MKSCFLVLFILGILFVEARVKRTNTLSFKRNSNTLYCNRKLANENLSSNNLTYTVDLNADCSSQINTSVDKVSFKVQSNPPLITVKAFKSAGDSNPQFSATLVFTDVFAYVTVNNSAPGFDPDTDSISRTQSLFGDTATYFDSDGISTSSIEGGGSVTTLTFFSVDPLSSFIVIKFIADVVNAPVTYNDSNGNIGQTNPNQFRLTVVVDDFSPLADGLGLRAYLITEKGTTSKNTDSNGRTYINLQSGDNDDTSGTLSWDSETYTSTDPNDNSLLGMISSSLASATFNKTGITDQLGNAQVIYFSPNTTSGDPVTAVWDILLEYKDVFKKPLPPSDSTILQINFLLIAFAVVLSYLY